MVLMFFKTLLFTSLKQDDLAAKILYYESMQSFETLRICKARLNNLNIFQKFKKIYKVKKNPKGLE
jgi:hypothetical protein